MGREREGGDTDAATGRVRVRGAAVLLVAALAVLAAAAGPCAHAGDEGGGGRNGEKPPEHSTNRPDPTPGDTPCPTCALCLDGVFRGYLAQSPVGAKVTFPVKWMTAQQLDASMGKLGDPIVLVREASNVGTWVSGTFAKTAGVQYVQLTWVDSASGAQHSGDAFIEGRVYDGVPAKCPSP